jgi:O-antigen biosynthesis protein
MTFSLRTLFRRRSRKALAAPLSGNLLLRTGRPRSVGAGTPRASTKLGKTRFWIEELAEGEAAESRATGHLDDLLDQLAPLLDQGAQADLFDFVLTTVLADLAKPGAATLAGSLRLLRDRFSRPLPELPADAPGGPVITVDTITAIDDRSFWFGGWSRDPDGTLMALEVVSPEGQRARLLEDAYRFTRPDVQEALSSAGIPSEEKHGFAKYVDLASPSPLSDGWMWELRTPTGTGFRGAAPAVIRDPQVALRVITELAPDELDVGDMRRDHGHAALQRLQARTSRSTRIDSDIQYGERPESPDVSIVVPLYRRIDFLEHQVVQFWQDPELCTSELIYVLDSPELAEPLTRLAAGLHDLYGLSFRVVTLNRNAGYSTANNIGASLARGRLLLLLNSDVLPSEPGWLGRMLQFHDATPDIGALGPKLLYEDDSIQHAGMYFQRDSRTGYWENRHYSKGFSRFMPAASVSRPVPAVTGACLMVERALWEGLGGLRDAYVQGGYEDSDLCLRLLDAGRQNWYLGSVELYHLEAQSFRIDARGANRYNAWLQTHLWDQRIEDVMRERPEMTALVAVLD